MRKRSSIIWTTTKDDMQKLVDTSSSISEILRKMGYKNIEGNHRTLKDRLEYDSIDIENLKKRGVEEKLKRMRNLSDSNTNSDDAIFIENSNYNRFHLKNRIINKKLIEYKCRDCGNEGSWNGNKLSLHLEHINGIGNDNRIENLCFLCPNCHSQTPTYGGKSRK